MFGARGSRYGCCFLGIYYFGVIISILLMLLLFLYSSNFCFVSSRSKNTASEMDI